MARDDVRAQLKRTIAQEQRRTDGTGRDTGRDWAVTGLMLLALGIALSGFRTVLQGGSWWMAAMLVATTVLLATAVIRSLVRFRLLALLAGAAAGAGMLTLLFAADVAWLGVIPNLQALQRFGELERAGGASIAGQGIPAQADDGITFLVCLGVAALAFAMELFATGARMPVLSGLSLLVVLLVPAIVDVGLHDPLTFVLTAAVYLGILLVSARRIRLRPALGVGAAALAATLLIPLGLPQVQPQALGGSGGGANTLNPIINLGNDLRRGDPEIAYTYTTSAEGGDYFRMTALDGFGGGAWSPVNRPDDGVELSALGGAPGLGDDVATASVTTDVVIGDVRSPWLPVPYAAQRIEGLEGSWRVDTDRLTIGTGDSDIEGQRYTVESAVPQPTVEQLRAAGDEVPTGFDRYTALPESIPDVVAETAEEVAGTAETNYDAALALQSYFQSGEFAYSEEAPVEGGYDGSGARILGDFLQIKAGYCVHFSSAMAAMARTLGIPSRVAVGFTAGTAVTQDGGQAYRVTTHDYHSWPELYFTGVGWVRFEPTPGRGDQPQFPLATQDDPATPDVDESAPVPPPAATPPTTAPTPTAVPEAA
ncbi:MAG TPA: DUF3488 and transglutaminase-like domain-containing protein, partial [Rhodoglobus sp.]|nr:DUF3488 and transglutaminase-like domain-containing protein [Rhodoglobus sp.]